MYIKELDEPYSVYLAKKVINPEAYMLPSLRVLCPTQTKTAAKKMR